MTMNLNGEGPANRDDGSQGSGDSAPPSARDSGAMGATHGQMLPSRSGTESLRELFGWIRCWLTTGHKYKFQYSLKVTLVYECERCGFSKRKFYYRGYSE